MVATISLVPAQASAVLGSYLLSNSAINLATELITRLVV
jgi:hypothetical protein